MLYNIKCEEVVFHVKYGGIMYKFVRRFCLIVVLLGFGLCLSFRVQAKTIKKDITLLQGSIRKVAMDSTDVELLKVTNRKVAVTAKDFFVNIKGKKSGKVFITYKISALKNTYKYNVTVLPVKRVKKKANHELKKVFTELPQGTKYIYFDFNGDGIKELFYDGRIVFFDYGKNKCESRKYDFKNIYISKKNKRILAIYQNPTTTSDFIYRSGFYCPSKEKVFGLDFTGTGFREYTADGRLLYSANAPYAYYDNFYDQDDYDYEALTEKQVIQRLKKKMPGCKKLY